MPLPRIRAFAPPGGGSLLPCYSFFARGYSGIIDRSMADFQLKMDDYASDGARCLTWKEAGAVMGYVVYYTPHDILARGVRGPSPPGPGGASFSFGPPFSRQKDFGQALSLHAPLPARIFGDRPPQGGHGGGEHTGAFTPGRPQGKKIALPSP